MNNLSKEQCIEILKQENENYKINQQFKTLPKEVQDNAKKVLKEFMNKPIKQFELFYSEETQETLHPYGDVTSDLWAYRLVANVYEDKAVLIQYEAGRAGNYDFVEWETVEPFDLHLNDMNITEFTRLMKEV